MRIIHWNARYDSEVSTSRQLVLNRNRPKTIAALIYRQRNVTIGASVGRIQG